MSTAIDHQSASALAITPDQTGFSDTQLAALQQLGVATNSPGDIAVFFHQAKMSGLDPFKREIYMITRSGKPTIQTGIDGFYKIADRVSRKTGGTWGITETYWCGMDGVWRDVWLNPSEAPAAAKVIVERNGAKFVTVALTSEYKAQGPMWKSMPARMIAKCAEALAIRKAFPEDLSGLYTSDEMAQAENRTSQRVVREPWTNQQQPEPSGRDWMGELQDCETREDVVQLWKAAQAHGELTDELKQELTVAGRALPAAVDVVTGEIITEGEAA